LARTYLGVKLKQNRFGFLYYLTLITELGLVMASCILIGLGLGVLVDGKFNTKPFGLFIFLLLGTFYRFADRVDSVHYFSWSGTTEVGTVPLFLE